MRRRLAILILLILSVFSFGTIGYRVIEGWSLLDSLYMTIITLTTIGFQEVSPLSQQGRIFTILFVLFGVGVLAYSLNTGARIIFEGEIKKAFGRRKLERKIRSIKDHYIVCGYGRMGNIICGELRAKKIPFIVIEKEQFEVDADEGSLFIFGDATSDEILRDAGIERAKGLVSVLSTDAQNLFVVLSARGLNPDLLIIARAGEEDSRQKLIRAGADRVVSPYQIGGLRIAHTLLKPTVVDFIEFATKTGNIELQMEEVSVKDGSKLSEVSLRDSNIGVIIVGIKRADGTMKFNPTSNTLIRNGDTLIALGEPEKLEQLEGLARA
ncbi:MAG: potassium channel protein [Nitrospirota bacterium]|nr:MAG: potassium channel protein [Nitrospirota bacterium]